MDIRKQSVSIMQERGIGLFNLFDSPISERKKETALYKMSGADSNFNRMALGNEFYSADYTGIKPTNIKELVPLCRMDSITIYERKTKTPYTLPVITRVTHQHTHSLTRISKLSAETMCISGICTFQTGSHLRTSHQNHYLKIISRTSIDLSFFLCYNLS